MVELNERVLEEIEHGGQSLLIEDVVSLVERSHETDRPGVSRETVMAYADALDEDPTHQIDVDTFREEIDARLTDGDAWEGDDKLYSVGSGRISTYPASWHETLGGRTDIRPYIAFLQDDSSGFEQDVGSGGAAGGIPEQQLLDIVSVVGRISRDEVKAQLEELRKRGEVVEAADQHPNAGVMLRDEDGESYRDWTLDS